MLLHIVLTRDFYAGIRYTGPQQPDDFWWPALGLDESSSARRSYDFPSSGLILLDDIGLPGNLGVRVFVEVAGAEAQTLLLTPESIAPSIVEWDEQPKLQVGRPHGANKVRAVRSNLIRLR